MVMKFLERMQQVFLRYPGNRFNDHLVAILNSEVTKRILFDSRQASVFAEMEESPPARVRQRLILPFDQFYLELTESIQFGDSIGPLTVVGPPVEEEFEESNYLHGVLVLDGRGILGFRTK